jgi:CHAT domain-containing protein
VVDEAASRVMQRFYAGLSTQREGKAAALRAAQVELLHDPKMAHPYFWAPFTIVGNWM